MKKFAILIVLASLALAAAYSASPLDKYWAAKSKNYPASKLSWNVKGWAAGQYVVLGVKNNGKPISVSRSLIVGKEGSAWIIENWSVDEKGRETVGQTCIDGYDKALSSGDTSAIDIVWIKSIGEDGKVVKTMGSELGMMKGMMRSSYESLVATNSAMTSGGAVTVPAGSFAGTGYYKSSAKTMGISVEGESWFSDSVPINGMVKSTMNKGKVVTELLDFGFDGKPKMK